MRPTADGTVVIGVGNPLRRDDGAGTEVISRLRGRVPAGTRLVLADGEPTALVEAWSGTRLTVVVDAVVTNQRRPAGSLYRLAVQDVVPRGRPASSHGLGLAEAVALADALGRLPGRLILHAVEAADVSHGAELSPAVAAAIEKLADAVLADLSP